MGQYYRPVLKVGNRKEIVYNRDVNGEYTLAKLLEHSWWENDLCLGIASKIYKHKSRLAWVGDYSEDKELLELGMPLIINSVWNVEGNDLKLKKDFNFTLDCKVLVNHSKKLFVNLSKYKKSSTSAWTYLGKDYIINPLPLLTAIGNDRGGGDYRDVHPSFELVGTWAWDVISIEDLINFNPTGYKELDLCFMELNPKYLKRFKRVHKYYTSKRLTNQIKQEEDRQKFVNSGKY